MTTPPPLRPYYGAAFRKRYMDCEDTRCNTLTDHAGHDPYGPEVPLRQSVPPAPEVDQ